MTETSALNELAGPLIEHSACDSLEVPNRHGHVGLLKRVDELDASLYARSIPHPRLKSPMQLADHLYLVAKQDYHDLARILELVNAVRQSAGPP